MNVNRRDFLKASAAVAGALALKGSGLLQLQKAMAGGVNAPPVIWLQGQGCSGCSVSLLNSIEYMTADELLLNTIDLKFHSTVMAAAGDLASGAAEDARDAIDEDGDRVGYVLVIEGAIPAGEDGDYCELWPGMTMVGAIESFAPGAIAVLAVGTCASYGGMSAGGPNPTDAMGVNDALDYLGLEATVINIPGCPSHPDWIVGTVARLLAVLAGTGDWPELDGYGRPTEFFGEYIHTNCPNKGTGIKAKVLSDEGCLAGLGCKGQQTHGDCPIRKWNSGAQDEPGVNWCIGARNPCQGCTDPDFPDKMGAFYNLRGEILVDKRK